LDTPLARTPANFGCKILKFADDTKIYHVVNSSTAIENLRSDLHNLVPWSNEWQMLFNIEKFKVMHLGYNNPKADYVVYCNVLVRKKTWGYCE